MVCGWVTTWKRSRVKCRSDDGKEEMTMTWKSVDKTKRSTVIMMCSAVDNTDEICDNSSPIIQIVML